ncbi:unnamed protein product [Trifolium pratense]|uniref:Uncharacterized protein n=1 Tax=Trifolium pratense TaxID=57577 RepID=A0ACB0KJ10_TRIPR|nr:unnamed protein product [Trifolium pratense]
MSSSRKINLKSSDGEIFEIDEAVAMESQTLKHMIEDCADNTTITTIHNVTGQILAKVIEYCKKHVEARSSETCLKAWDAEFIKAIADMMVGKTPEEIRNTFNIVNDYSPEEEEEVRREIHWAFE